MKKRKLTLRRRNLILRASQADGALAASMAELKELFREEQKERKAGKTKGSMVAANLNAAFIDLKKMHTHALKEKDKFLQLEATLGLWGYYYAFSRLVTWHLGEDEECEEER